MSDEIQEIRARHLRDERWRYSPSMICPQMHDDRAFLLAEVDRQRAETERLRAANKELVAGIDNISRRNREEIERLRAEIERMKRDSDEACDESNPVQKPVAWRNKNWGHFTINPIASNHPDWEPLYTEQQTRQRRNALEGKP